MQVFINLAAQTALLLPLTGIPLPFISYGGSALIINLAAIGILDVIFQDKKLYENSYNRWTFGSRISR
jgi:cell division protein FtsW (lipid II flippase)